MHPPAIGRPGVKLGPVVLRRAGKEARGDAFQEGAELERRLGGVPRQQPRASEAGAQLLGDLLRPQQAVLVQPVPVCPGWFRAVSVGFGLVWFGLARSCKANPVASGFRVAAQPPRTKQAWRGERGGISANPTARRPRRAPAGTGPRPAPAAVQTPTTCATARSPPTRGAR